MGTILDEIVAAKRREVTQRQAARSLAEIRRLAADAEPPRDFHAAIAARPRKRVHLITEIKRKSPSAGLIRPDFDPAAIARAYRQAGASCLSVLTDEPYFDGRLEYVAQVKRAVDLPVLRKDFMVDPWQIYESRAAGADCILLIGEVLAPALLREMLELACGLGMTSLIEVHEQATLEALIEVIGFPNDRRSLLGINNRDLKVQRTDLSTTGRLATMVGEGTLLVAESGVKTRQDVDLLVAAGARALLVGETLMRSGDIAAATRELLGE